MSSQMTAQDVIGIRLSCRAQKSSLEKMMRNRRACIRVEIQNLRVRLARLERRLE